MMRKIVRLRGAKTWDGAKGSEFMGSALASLAMSAFATGAGVSGSPAQAAIAPEDALGVVRSYRIPAGSVAAALNDLADENGLHVAFPAGLTQGLRTPGLAGAHSLREALDRLLAGTRLIYQLSDNRRTVLITLAQNDTVRSDGAEALPAIDIGAERPRVDGPSNGKPVLTPQNSYVVPNATTATKTDTPVMETPINVQTVTQKALEDQQATTLRDALQNVSGVTVPTASAGDGSQRTLGIFVRGFTTQEFYQDGVRVNGSLSGIDFTGSQQFANIGSIELLKGPAAILYGLSEPGGIINITTREPLETPQYAAQQQVGALAFYRTSLSATGPVTSDKSVLYRVDMSYENNGAPFGSFIDRTHSRNFFVAPVVKWQIDNATWVKAEVNYSNDLSSLYPAYTPTINGLFAYMPRNYSYSGDAPALQTTVNAALTAAHNFNDNWSFRSRVSFRNTNYDTLLSQPALVSAGANPNVTVSTTDTEYLLSSWQTNHDLVGHFNLFGAKNTLLLGGDYSRFSSATASQVNVPWAFSRISLLNPIFPGLSISPPFPTVHIQNYNRQDTAGLYVQDQVELPYGFHVMAGARYQYIYQASARASTLNSFATLSPVTNTGDPLHAARVTPRFGLLWRPQYWVSLYGNYTEGFAANTGNVYPGTLAPPSNAESWEAGAKFELFDGRLRANLDYYNLVKTNIPISDPDTTHLCGGTPSCVAVIGKARSSGPEVDIQGEILPGWNVILNYTNQDVRVAEGNEGSLKVGQRFPNVPRNLARLWTTYEFQDPSLKGLKVGAGYTYHGSQPVNDATGGKLGTIPLLWSWGTVDLMAAYSFDLDGVKTTAQINATNIFDRTYYTYGRVASALSPNYSLNSGLTWGAPFNIVGSLKFEF
ncbi:TonB-dependent siderophore receptor [Methylosinus sporium]|uniref:TonB-dependent siderophore receptor n=1 Tax=Methylosinus sporium TaxID=428 RepID=UPI00383AA438